MTSFPPAAFKDLWIVAGNGMNRASERAVFALGIELAGGGGGSAGGADGLDRGLMCHRTARALYITKNNFNGWVSSEADIMQGAAAEAK